MISSELVNILEIAKENLLKNESGELILPIRKKIWIYFGENRNILDRESKMTVGQRRRVKLALLCVNKVIRIWEESMNSSEKLSFLLNLLKKYIVGEITGEYFESEIDSFRFYLDEVQLDEIGMLNSIGLALCNLLYKAIIDEVLLIDRSLEEIDDDLDPYFWDASYYVSIAYSGGAKWQKESDKEKRREFWKWYIEEAVPNAYKDFSL